MYVWEWGGVCMCLINARLDRWTFLFSLPDAFGEKAIATRAAVIVNIMVLPPHLPSGGAEYRGGNGALSCDACHLQLDENSSAT